MRIAGGIIGIALAFIIFVQSLAAGTANALAEQGSNDSGGSIGFVVGILFLVASALLLGKVTRGAMITYALASVIAVAGGASTIFQDLIVWGVVASVYAVGIYWSRRHASHTIAPTMTATTREP